MKSISESMKEFEQNEKVSEAKIELENGRHEYPYKKMHWPVEIRADIGAKGGMKGKGTSVSLFLKDESGKAIMKGFQGPATIKSVSDFIKKWEAKGMLPNNEAEGFNEAVDVDSVIKALVEVNSSEVIKDLIDTDWSKDNKSQMRAVQLLKGIALSDEPAANDFMKKIDNFTSGLKKQ